MDSNAHRPAGETDDAAGAETGEREQDPAARLVFLERRDRPGILHVIQHRQPSGAEVSHLPLMLADPDPLLACPPASATERFAQERGIRTVAIPYRSLRQSAGNLEVLRSFVRAVRSALDLRRILQTNPERTIVVGNTLTPSLIASLAAVGLRRRPVWVAAQLLRHRPVRAVVRLMARTSAARIVVPSRAAYDDLVGHSRMLKKRTRIVAPGVQIERFQVQRRENPVPRAALVGYISPVKRTEMAIEIALRVAAHLPAFELLIVGQAQYRPEDFALERRLRDRVDADSWLREHVHFCGHDPDVPARLATVDALLHCCPTETFGMALLEAMAAGLPVVAPRAGGPTDIVDHEVTGLLYAPGDVEQASVHLARVLTDPVEARAMGRAGRARVQRLFSGPAYVARFSSVLEGLVRPTREVPAHRATGRRQREA